VSRKPIRINLSNLAENRIGAAKRVADLHPAHVGKRRSMKPESQRRFTLADAMILIASFCVGGAAARSCYLRHTRFGRPWNDSASLLIECLSWFLLCVVPAWVVIRLRTPHPIRRTLFAQAGVQAALAVVLTLPLWHIYHAVDFITEDWAPSLVLEYLSNGHLLGTDLARSVGPNVAIIWIATMLAGRRRAESHWIDRVGRFLGWSWIALWLMNGLHLIFQRYR
jgi:hypothetical protein